MNVYITRDIRNGRVYWACIINGMPICNDKLTQAEAENAAHSLNLRPTAVWDSVTGKYWPLDTFAGQQ
jgi:hypothetical protein